MCSLQADGSVVGEGVAGAAPKLAV